MNTESNMEISGEQRALLRDACVRYQVRRLRLFGSAATGGFGLTSDVDLVAEFVRPFPQGAAQQYFGLLETLQRIFGRDVDLLVDSAIVNPIRAKQIAENAILLYAA